MLLDGLTLAFATIPEELPILVTVLVAVGGLRLARRGVLLRKLRSAEAVGAITVLLTDKTGTLTENQLRLEQVEGERTRVLETAVAALGGATPQDPLDLALAAALGAPARPGPARRFPFDPQRKRESTVWSGPETTFVAVKGAPEAVLEACVMSHTDRDHALTRVSELAQLGLRVIAVAARHTDRPPRDALDAERELSFVGLAAFADPLRAGVREAVETLAGAGVRTILVTGCHPVEAVRELVGVLAQLRREAVTGIHARRGTESFAERVVLGNQGSRSAPRRDRVQALDEAGSDEGAGAVALATRPAERVKVADQFRNLR